MSEQFSVEYVTGHQFIVRTNTEGGILESWIRADPDVIEELGLKGVDELEIVRQTAVFLAGHQPVEDFPPMLDFIDVMASYEDYAEQSDASGVRRRSSGWIARLYQAIASPGRGLPFEPRPVSPARHRLIFALVSPADPCWTGPGW